MPTFSPRTTMSALVLSGLLSSTTALSLANFTPRIENLPSTCQSVYVTEIENCTRDDFFNPDGRTCSAPCVQGLVKISKLVERACSGVDVPETSVIGLFLLGKGISVVCPGIAVVTVTPSSSAPKATQTQGEERSSTTKEETATTTSKAEEDLSSTATTTSTASSSTGGIAIDTTVPRTFATAFPTAAPQPPSSVAPPKPVTTAVEQKSNEDSGGGSPFDIVAGGAASSLLNPLRSLAIGTAIGALMVVFAAL